MYIVSDPNFKTLLNSGAIQKIKGTVIDSEGGTYFTLTEDNISNPQFTRQCTTQTDSFGYGQLYTSTVKVGILNQPELLRTNLRGMKLTLQFGVEGSNEWVPLGIWNITDPQRESADRIVLNGVDNTSKLDVPISDNSVGIIKLQTRMNMISDLTGLDFAQTIDELSVIAGKNLNSNTVFGAEFTSSCRTELTAIAQYIGGIVYIDRTGKIAFRKYGGNPDIMIPDTQRFNIELAEYDMRVASIGFKGRRGMVETPQAAGTHANADVMLDISGNPLIWQADTEDILAELTRIRENVAIGKWVPGTLDWYGDPTIDLGDLVTLTGGINGSTNTPFLVTGYTWQFRGPMTLISAGVTEQIGYSSGSSTGTSVSSGGSVQVVQKPWNMVELESYPQALTSRWREIAAAQFAVAEQTLVIAHLTVNFTGSDIGEVVVHVLLDGVMQTEYSLDTIAGSQKLTTEKNVPLLVESGVHRLTIEAKGAATVDRIVASVYGQGVSEYTGESTFDTDYRYHEDSVDEYLGRSTTPRIPTQLGGNDVHVLAGGSFSEKNIEYTYIPDGVETIE